MDEQLKRLKTKTVIVIILALLALTWQYLDYLTIKKYIPFDEFGNVELLIIISSYLFFIILFISIISLAFSAFRTAMKYKSEKKKNEKEKNRLPLQNINPDILKK